MIIQQRDTHATHALVRTTEQLERALGLHMEKIAIKAVEVHFGHFS